MRKLLFLLWLFIGGHAYGSHVMNGPFVSQMFLPPQSERNLDRLIATVWPIVQTNGFILRLYYGESCESSENGAVSFPGLNLQPPTTNLDGVQEIESVFRKSLDVKIQESNEKIIRIYINDPETEILKVEIDRIKFPDVSMYNTYWAINWIVFSEPVKAMMTRLRLGFPYSEELVSGIVHPNPIFPHMPNQMTDKSMDGLLDKVAEQFHVAILYGVCKNRSLFNVFSYSGDR